MVKIYKKVYQKWDEIKIINVETGEFNQYNVSREIGFPFGVPYITTVQEMGYNDVKQCLKELKSRNILGIEIDYKEQKEAERIGYINLGVERIKRARRLNTKDFEDVILKLEKYGMSYCDAQNSIITSYENRMNNKSEVN